MILPKNIERDLREIEAEYAACGDQQAGAPRLRSLRASIEAELEQYRALPRRVTPPRLRGEPERIACPMHDDPLVCLACEVEEDVEWRRRGLDTPGPKRWSVIGVSDDSRLGPWIRADDYDRIITALVALLRESKREHALDCAKHLQYWQEAQKKKA